MISTLLLLGLVGFCSAAPIGHLVAGLPGQPHVGFKQYAGYVDVHAQLQGGPGGLFTENGPWVVEQGRLTERPTSWNRLANMLFIESPAGVGFSYDGSASIPTTGDNQTRSDLYTFLHKWTDHGMFPEYAQSDLFISGESYGGHYVPQLSWTILNENKKAARKLNLKGMLVGNPWTSDEEDGKAVLPWIYSHTLCSKKAWLEVEQACGLTKLPDVTKGHRDFHPTNRFLRALRKERQGALSCQQAEQTMMNEIGDRINQYDIYVDCQNTTGGLPCINNDLIVNYLNSAPVQHALHVRSSLLKWPWAVCDSHLNYASSWSTVVPIYPQIIEETQHVMVYSGDVTFNCGSTGSENWIHDKLAMPITEPWKNWMLHDQTGGYKTGYGKNNVTTFTFVTVRDAGHMVPTYQPERAFKMLENYLAGVF